MKIFKAPLLFLAFPFFFACQNVDCVNSNTVLNSRSPESVEYRAELAKLIAAEGQSNLSYQFESYKEKNGQEYIQVNLQGKGFCGTADLTVNDWSKIKALKVGGGYRGAELKGLTFDIVDNTAGKIFVFKDIDSIID